jgi:hypothetical protein
MRVQFGALHWDKNLDLGEEQGATEKIAPKREVTGEWRKLETKQRGWFVALCYKPVDRGFDSRWGH